MTINFLLLRILMLPAGITLTVITILRMRSGRISLPQWAKYLLIIGMILSQLIIAAAMLPPSVYGAIGDSFVKTDTQPVAPLDPSASAVNPDGTN